MYNQQDIQFEGKHDFDKQKSDRMACQANYTFSVGIFQWQLSRNGKFLKKGKIKVRVAGHVTYKKKVYEKVEEIIRFLDTGENYPFKTTFVKPE